MYDESYEDEVWSDSTIFTLNGEPIPIHLHHSLGRGGRKAMARKIKAFRLLSSDIFKSLNLYSRMQVEIQTLTRMTPELLYAAMTRLSSTNLNIHMTTTDTNGLSHLPGLTHAL